MHLVNENHVIEIEVKKDYFSFIKEVKVNLQ